MAVSKIRKTSSAFLMITMLITVVVLAMFFLGGVVDPAANNKEYNYTSLLLNWVYILFFVSVVGMLLFGIIQFIRNFKTKPKKAMMSLGVLIAFAALLFVTYSIGDGTPLKLLGDSAESSNTEGWLKIADMWLYTTYVLTVFIIIAIVIGSIRKAILKRK